MGQEDVVLTGRAELDQIIKQLTKIKDHAVKTEHEIGQSGKKVDETLLKSSKTVERSVKSTSSLMRRMLNQLWGDVKALASLEAVSGSLKLSNQFRSSIKESIQLSDTIRRLGGSFGVAKKDFGSFQASLAKGLGDIGASSEAAASALEGLSGLGVKGVKSAQNLATGAVTLAGMGGEKGNEKAVAAGLGAAIKGMGMDINDASAQQKLIGEVTAAVKTTGKSASEILGAMEQIGSTMDKSLRGRVGPEAMAQMATIAATVGPQATKAMQEYLSKSTIDRQAMEQQGVNFFDKEGKVDVKALTSFIKEGQKRIGFDPRKALQTFGFSEEAAEGLVRIGEKSAEVQSNMEALATATRDNVAAFKGSMGMLDAFKGSINRVKGNIEQFTQGWSQKATDLLSSATESDVGAAAVVGGGGLLAALLAGGGLRGIGGALGKGLAGRASAQASEALTGRTVQDVYVVNAAEIAGGGALGAAGGLGGKLAGLAKGGLGVGLAAAAGYGAGSLAEPFVSEKLNKYTTGTTDEGFEGNVVERLFFKLDKLLGGDASSEVMRAQKMQIEIDSKDPNLKGKVKSSRGMTF